MESVVSRIQTLGVEVVPIPGGYTCVIQPCWWIQQAFQDSILCSLLAAGW
jgi:hypothetical protein